MKTVSINLSSCYDVICANGILSKTGDLAKKTVTPSKAVIISDKKVFSLYGEAVKKSFQKAGFTVFCREVGEGEAAKSFESYKDTLSFLSSVGINKTDCLVSLGGGSIGDLTGFCAATYLRGIKYFQIPTTLLAAVDASVGGKTAVNMGKIKNQVGAIYQPSAVFCDTDTFATLSDRDYNSGCGEIIKYTVLGGEPLFSLVESGIKENTEEIISHCLEIKKAAVQTDEYDLGERQKLNLGHTIAHAVEKCSDFSVTHGEAVAIGLAAIMRFSADNGYCSNALKDRVTAALKRYNLPTSANYKADELFCAALSDKKIRNGKINLIIPKETGKCEIMPFPTDVLKKVVLYE